MEGQLISTGAAPVNVPSVRIAAVAALFATECQRAQQKHPKPLVSPHEAYAVILEEVDEFWDEVRAQKHDPAAMKKELIQIGAMAMRTIVDLGL